MSKLKDLLWMELPIWVEVLAHTALGLAIGLMIVAGVFQYLANLMV